MTRHEIQVLRQAGVPTPRVAAQTQVSERSVWRIAGEAARPRGRPVGRPSTVTAWTAAVTGWLAEERTLPGVEVLRRVRTQGYAGGRVPCTP